MCIQTHSSDQDLKTWPFLPLLQVAVKIPTNMTSSMVDTVMSDLRREIETMARLDHPNIVRLLGITYGEWRQLNLMQSRVPQLYVFVMWDSLIERASYVCSVEVDT